MHAQKMESLSFDKMLPTMLQGDDTLYVLNFWATWCKPCIDELPAFEKINTEYSASSVKVILINLDFNSHVEKAVLPFIQKKNLQSKVIHLTDTDADTWINKVDSSWSGAIPATVIYRNKEKLFFKEGQMSYEEISNTISELHPLRDR